MLLIVVVWSWIAVPNTLQTLLSPKYRSSVGSNNVPYSRVAALADYGLYVAVIAVCAAVILGYLNHVNTQALGRLAAMIVPWGYIVIRDLYVPTKITHEGVCYLLIVVAIWTLRPELRRLQVLGYLMGLTATLSIVIAIFMPDHAIFRTALGEVIAEDKQVLPWGILVGIFTQGNNLAQFLALGLPTVFLIRRRRDRVLLVGISCLAIVWSASRGSMLAVAIGALAYVVLSLSWHAVRRIVGVIAAVAPFVVVCVVPLVTTDPTAFTNRGLVWLVSLKVWHTHEWIGNGSAYFNIVGSTSARIAGSVFHGHNQFVQFMVTGGLIFGFLVIPQMLLATGRAARFAVQGQVFGVVWLSVLGATCLFEKSFAYVDNGNFLAAMVVPFAILMFAPPRTGDGTAESTTDSERADLKTLQGANPSPLRRL